MSQTVIDKIDELLKDDRNFTTRSGLRLALEVLQDAIEVNTRAREHIEAYEKNQGTIETRLKSVESWQDAFSQKRDQEQKDAAVERKQWRLAILAPTILLVVGEIVKWLASK